MKYEVIGLGAVGSIVGGFLAKSGENVVLIGKKNQVEIIKQRANSWKKPSCSVSGSMTLSIPKRAGQSTTPSSDIGLSTESYSVE